MKDEFRAEQVDGHTIKRWRQTLKINARVATVQLGAICLVSCVLLLALERLCSCFAHPNTLTVAAARSPLLLLLLLLLLCCC